MRTRTLAGLCLKRLWHTPLRLLLQSNIAIVSLTACDGHMGTCCLTASMTLGCSPAAVAAELYILGSGVNSLAGIAAAMKGLLVTGLDVLRSCCRQQAACKTTVRLSEWLSRVTGTRDICYAYLHKFGCMHAACWLVMIKN